MTYEQTRQVLKDLTNGILVPPDIAIQRTMQTAKQIGSGWLTQHIEVIQLYPEEFRIVIE